MSDLCVCVSGNVNFLWFTGKKRKMKTDCHRPASSLSGTNGQVNSLRKLLIIIFPVFFFQFMIKEETKFLVLQYIYTVSKSSNKAFNITLFCFFI